MTFNLKTGRLALVTPCGGTVAIAPYVRWLNDPEVVKFSEQRHNHHTVASQSEFFNSFDRETSFIWEIRLHDGTPIGSITAYLSLPNKRAEMGILIGEKSEWRKGYGAEAWQAVMDWLGSWGIEKIEGGCHPLNIGMILLFGRVGMQMEARIHDHFLSDNGIREPLFRFGKLLNV